MSAEFEDRIGAAVQDIALDLDEEIYALVPRDQNYLLLEAAAAAAASLLIQGFLDGVKQAISDSTAHGVRAAVRQIMKSVRGRFSTVLSQQPSTVDHVVLESKQNVADSLRELRKLRSAKQLEGLADIVQLDFQQALMEEGLSASSSVAIAGKLGRQTIELLSSPDDTKI